MQIVKRNVHSSSEVHDLILYFNVTDLFTPLVSSVACLQKIAEADQYFIIYISMLQHQPLTKIQCMDLMNGKQLHIASLTQT